MRDHPQLGKGTANQWEPGWCVLMPLRSEVRPELILGFGRRAAASRSSINPQQRAS